MPEKLAALLEAPLRRVGGKTAEFSDLDMIGHVNNAKYIEWILNDWVRQSGAASACKSLEINYLNEVLNGETCHIFSQKKEHAIYFELKQAADGRDICRAKLGF